MSNFCALFDACVLYPAPLRDFLMHLSLTNLFRAKWSERIHEEWISNLLKKRSDLTREKLERTKSLMNKSAECCVVEGYEDLIEVLVLPDPNDRHVLAAAIKAGAGVIVTFNLKDFPEEALKPYGIDVQDPDTFIMHLLDLNPGAVCVAAKRQRVNLQNPPKSIKDFLEILESQGLPQTVSRLRSFAELI